MQKLVLLKQLVLDAGTQIRTELDKSYIEDLAEVYKEGRKLPPSIDTFYIDGKFVVADGFHRAYAAEAAGLDHIKSEVHAGNLDKALLFALSANASHGLRRTNADKRNAVDIAIAKWKRKSNREIADICAVSAGLVDRIRPSKEKTPEDLPTVGECKPSEEITKSDEPAPPPMTTEPAPAPRPKSTEPAPAPVAAPAPAPAPAPVLNGVYDEMGYPIPKLIVETYIHRTEMLAVLDHLQKAKLAVNKIMECGGHPAWAHLSLQGFLGDLGLACNTLSGCIPYAVCPYCQGLNTKQCANCKHTGIVGRWNFERQTPVEIQTLRKKHIEDLRKK